YEANPQFHGFSAPPNLCFGPTLSYRGRRRIRNRTDLVPSQMLSLIQRGIGSLHQSGRLHLWVTSRRDPQTDSNRFRDVYWCGCNRPPNALREPACLFERVVRKQNCKFLASVAVRFSLSRCYVLQDCRDRGQDLISEKMPVFVVKGLE